MASPKPEFGSTLLSSNWPMNDHGAIQMILPLAEIAR